jgi:methionyl-tRNA formyltransferase
VINGESETGVTTFFLKHAIDTGDLLLQKRLSIGPNETTGEVYERLMLLGAEALVESVELIAQGKTSGLPQNPELVSHAPKVYHETGKINWSASAKTCHNLIRGLNPFPGAWTLYEGKEVKFLRTLIIDDSEVLAKAAAFEPGTLIPLDKHETRDQTARGLAITTGNHGLLEILEVKPAGKKAMSGSDWRNGLRLEEPLPL